MLATGTEVEVTGLMKYTQYSVYVEASTVAGVGERSDTVTVFTDEDSECVCLTFSVLHNIFTYNICT